MSKNFRNSFLKIDSRNYRESLEDNEIYQLQKILSTLEHTTKRSYTTKQFCEAFTTYEGVRIDPSVQSDADEFYNALMDKVETFLKTFNSTSILE